MKNLPFNLCIAFLALIIFVKTTFSSPTPIPTATIIPTPTVSATTTVSATPTPHPPTVTTGEATGECASFTLTGTVNANGLLTTTWFEYGTVSGSYIGTSSTQTVAGEDDTTVSMEIDVPYTGDYGEVYNWCTGETTYFDYSIYYHYRIAAQNIAGISYGGENGFVSGCHLIGDNWDCPCVGSYITCDSEKLSFKKKEIRDVTVTVTGDTEFENYCAVEGLTVTAIINNVGKKCISILPKSTPTDENGEATFTITAKNKTGNARITFKAGVLKKSIVVKVRGG